jgi:hypothetical protein
VVDSLIVEMVDSRAEGFDKSWDIDLAEPCDDETVMFCDEGIYESCSVVMTKPYDIAIIESDDGEMCEPVDAGSAETCGVDEKELIMNSEPLDQT